MLGGGRGSCACFYSDLVIKGNSGNQACWEWYFLFNKNVKTEQVEPSPSEASPLVQELCQGSRGGTRVPGLCAQGRGRCFGIVFMVVVATGRLGGPKTALQGCES